MENPSYPFPKKNLLLTHLLQKQSQSLSPQSENKPLEFFLGEMTDDEICEIMRPALKKFVVYRHIKIEDVINWRTNTAEARGNKHLEIVDYADTVEEAVRIVAEFKKRQSL